uniref:Uncharacterized protein n=1 Tax=Panagrolaimus sp. PS1159 TaxID=55785 RepID=A0AC35EXL6_9BILA
MSSKNDIYSFIEQSFTTSQNQHYNLNLNQYKKCPILVPVQSYSKPNNDNYCVSDNYEGKVKLQSLNESSKTSNFTTLNEDNNDLKKRWENKNILNITKKSTLSLHIAAYENPNEAVASNLFDEKNVERLKKEKLFFTNPFEFPRQQNENQRNEPEIMQFKTTQRLLSMEETLLLQVCWFIIGTFATLTWSLFGGNKVPRHGEKPTTPPPAAAGAKKDEGGNPQQKDEKKSPMKRIKEKAKGLRTSLSKERKPQPSKPATTPTIPAQSKEGPGKKVPAKLSTEVKPKTKDAPKAAPATPVATATTPSPIPPPSPAPSATPPTKLEEGKKQQTSDPNEKKKDEKEKKAGNFISNSLRESRKKLRRSSTPTNGAAATTPTTTTTTTTTTTSRDEASPASPNKHNKFITALQKFKHSMDNKNQQQQPGAIQSVPEVGQQPENVGAAAVAQPQSPGTPASPIDPNNNKDPAKDGGAQVKEENPKKEMESGGKDDKLKPKKEITVEMESGGKGESASKEENDPDAAPTVFELINAPVKPMKEPAKKTKSKSRKTKTIRIDVTSPNVTDSKDSKDNTGTTGTTKTSEEDNSQEKKKEGGGGGKGKEDDKKESKPKDEAAAKKDNKPEADEKAIAAAKDGKPKEEKTKGSDSKDEKK